MNRRFKLFKKAVDSKNAEDWANYKILRNEITSDMRKAKAAYFQAKLDEVKTSGAYWNPLNNAIKPKATKSIGQLKRENESLVVDEKEKANLMNTFFSSVGEKLARSVEPLPFRPIIKEAVPCLSDIPLSCSIIEKKPSLLKPFKATGPDGISPRLLKARRAISRRATNELILAEYGAGGLQ